MLKRSSDTAQTNPDGETEYIPPAFPLAMDMWGTEDIFDSKHTNLDANTFSHPHQNNVVYGINCKVKILEFHPFRNWIVYVTEREKQEQHVIVYDYLSKEILFNLPLEHIITLSIMSSSSSPPQSPPLPSKSNGNTLSSSDFVDSWESLQLAAAS